jgi:3-phenylpropionate/trans-cinnamate dioxygenase ferredoxin subunit
MPASTLFTKEFMSDFIKVATTSEWADGEKRLIEVEDRLVILFCKGGEFYCIDDVCTHDGGTLSDGELVGCEIECPRHGAKFDIRNGKALCMPATQDTVAHQTKIDGSDVWVKLSDD